MKLHTTLLLLLIPFILYSQKQESNSNIKYNLETSFGVSIGEGECGFSHADINLLNGISINNRLVLNLGIGIQTNYEEVYTPIFGDLKLFFSDTKYAPYIGIESGKTFKMSNQKDNYRFLNLAFGIRAKGKTLVGIKYYTMDIEEICDDYNLQLCRKCSKSAKSIGLFIVLDLL